MNGVRESAEDPLARELALALDLAIRGGAIALDLQRAGADALGTVDKPAGGGPVTKADIAVDDLVVAAIAEAFPDDAILAEETHARTGAGERERLERPRCWMIDPVDGTRDFSGGASTWAVHIGLCVEGVPRLGVVHEPAADRTSFGLDLPSAQGGGAWVRDADGLTRPLDLSLRAPAGALRLVTSKSHRTPEADDIVAALGISPEHDLRLGSTGVKIARVARGEADVYAHPGRRTKLWDSCAPQAILHAAGGRLSDLRGVPLDFLAASIGHTHGLLAAPADLHPKIVEKIAPIATRFR